MALVIDYLEAKNISIPPQRLLRVVDQDGHRPYA
jgi:hypothetical protein